MGKTHKKKAPDRQKTPDRKKAPERPAPSSAWLWAILGIGAIARLIYLLELRRTPFFDHLLLDLASYDTWAKKIAAGEWLGAKAFYQDPLYPYFLGIIYWLVGHRLAVVYVLQLALGLLTCYLIYRLARRLFSAPAGLLAAAMAAVYKPFIFYDVQIEKTFLAVLLVTAACFLLTKITRAPNSPMVQASAGLVLGLAVLIRGNYLFLLPFVLLGILLFSSLPRRGRAAAWYLLGTGLILALTLAHNYFVGHDLVLTTSQAGQNFYIGNNPQNLTGMYRAPDFVRPDPKFEEVDFAREAERQAGRSLKPSEVSRFWMLQALSFVKNRPGEFLQVLAQKSALFWNNFEIPDNLDMYFFGRYSLVMRLWLPTFGWIAPLGILGMVLCIKEWRRLWPIYLLVLGYFFSVILFYVFARYRLPVVPFLMLFAAEAVLRLVRIFREHQNKRLVLAGVILVAAMVAVNVPMLRAYNPAALDNLGAVLLGIGDLDGAESLFRQVIARRPDFADAHSNLSVVLLRRGDAAAAAAEIREAIRLNPQHAGAYVNLGSALLQQKQFGPALQAFQQALELDPHSQQAWQGLGELHRQQGDLPGAEDACRRALQIDPDSAEAHNNLGTTLVVAGKYQEALSELQTAIRLDPGFARAFFNQGVCYEKLRMPDQAITAYRAAIAGQPESAEAYCNLANLLAEKGDRTGAVEAFRDFLRRWKGDPAVRSEIEQEIRKLR